MKKLFAKLTFVLLICALITTIAGCGLFDDPGDTTHTHEYTEQITKPATCTEMGEKTMTCSCGDSYIEAFDMLPHTEEAIPAVAPTCTEAGLTEGKKCSVCDTVIVAQQPVDAKGHTEEEIPAVAPTCTEAGLTAGKKCTVCDTVTVAQQPVDAKGHTEEAIPAVAPTCTEAGLTAGKKCSVCDTVITAQDPVPATGHKFDDNYDATCNNEGCEFVREADCRHSNTEILPSVAPTCTTAGLTEGKKCKDCGELLTAQQTVDATGHSYTPVVTAPTCTEAGFTTYTCSACSDSYVDNRVDAKNHSEKTLAAVAPTCTKTGLTEGKQCSVCNEILSAQQTVDALGHTEKTLSAVAPTCTKTGLTEGKQCSVCNEILSAQQTVDALGHTDSAAVRENVKDSTCSSEGSYESVVYCSVCSAEISRTTEVIAKKAHTEVIDAAVAPDCTETGLTEGKHCSVCKAVIVAQDVVDALGHTEVTIAGKAATCTATGLTDGKKCSVCNEELVRQETIDALGHTVNVLPAVEATCTKEGKTEGRYCSVCSEVFAIQATVAKLPHTYTDDSDLNCNACNAKRDCLHPEDERVLLPGKDATCTETGLEDGYKCNVCGETVVAQKVIDSLGHTESGILAKDPTCTEPGNTAGKKCIVCNAILVAPTSIPAKGHTEKTLAASAASCTATGLTEGKQCTVCGVITKAQEIVPMIAHNYSEELSKDETQHWHACIACGARADVSDHAYTVETGRKNATCTTEGYYTLECECGATKSVTLTAPGHSYSKDWTETETHHWHACTACGDEADYAAHEYTTETARVEATCTSDGYFTKACVCGATKTTAIEASGHSYTTVVTAPTCTEAGFTTYTCSVCKDSYQDDTVAAKGHSYVSVVTDPTCTAEGFTTHTCSVCEDSYKDAYVDALGHSYKSVVVAPTCTEAGFTTYTCSVCNNSYVSDNKDALGHTYSDKWTSDGENHWHQCHCGDKTEIGEHEFDSVCDADCNVCGATRIPADHVYDNACDADCNVCGDTRATAGHVYDNACDTDCNVCGTVREVGDHVYDNDCDADCNECGKTREVGAHVYDNDCDASCNNCGAIREVGAHVYDNDCDASCNVCGAEREVGDHVYDGDRDVDCNVCGATRTVAPILLSDAVAKNHDIYWLDNKESFVIDFAENISNPSGLELTYVVRLGGEELVLDGSRYTFIFGEYDEETVINSFSVTVSYTVNGEEVALEYSYELSLKDTSKYRVVNSNFDKNLDGWELNNTLGDAPFAGIDEKSTFWGEGYPMFNVGKYFSSYADGAAEGSHGNLASSYFIVNSDYATYMLGGGGNHHVYITIENKAGDVLALYRNTEFTDFNEEQNKLSVDERRELIGNTVFLANLVTYKIDLTDFAGEEIRFVVHDYASEGWGVVYFDELHTYYASESELPEGATLAENLLANKDALNAELALEIAEQGDFTEDSYNAYIAKLDAAKALVNDIAVTQGTVNGAVAALTEARLALTVRPIEEIEGANKSFKLISDDVKEITLADYINVNGLSKITYNVYASNAAATISPVADGRFTITAGEVSETTDVVVSISVCYDGEEKLLVELSVQITNDLAPTLRGEEISKNYDLYDFDDKSSISLDLAENIDNPGNLALTYSVNGNVIEGSIYTKQLGSYNDKLTEESFTVTVSCTVNGESVVLEYTYRLSLKDTTDYRLVNGDFENGLEGWTQVGNIGGVSSDTHYWLNDPERAEGYEFGMDGNGMFSAYAPGASEGATGTLTSSTFKVGGSGYVTFKLGAAKDANYVYVEVCDFVTGRILARYSNANWADRTEGAKSGCTLNAYRVDLSAYMGKTVFFRVVDTAYSDYGLFFVDSFETYYESAPEGFADAVECDRYQIANGSFESGNLNGWTMNITEAGAHNTLGWVQNGEIAEGWYTTNDTRKDGNYLFTFYSIDKLNCENTKGTLTSSTFTLKKNTYISFKFGAAGSSSVSIRLIKTDGTNIASFYNESPYKVNTELHSYYYHYTGEETDCYILIIDNAESNYGCFVVDDFRVNLETKPSGYRNAAYGANVNYDIANGSFEDGLDGWTMDITEAGAQNTLGWVERSEHDAGWYTKNDGRKDGSNLFTFCRPDGTNCENTKGSLRSATFTLKQNSFVSFRFGGAGTRDVYVQLCREDGSVIATFYNEATGKVNTEMYAYYYQYTGEEANCYFRVVDNSTSNYGCFVVDDFRANLESAPEGFIAAIQ